MTKLNPSIVLDHLTKYQAEIKSEIKSQIDMDRVDVEVITELTQKLGKIDAKISCWNNIIDIGLDNTINYVLNRIVNIARFNIQNNKLNSSVILEAYSDWLKSLPIAIRVQYNLE